MIVFILKWFESFHNFPSLAYLERGSSPGLTFKHICMCIDFAPLPMKLVPYIAVSQTDLTDKMCFFMWSDIPISKSPKYLI